MLQRHALAVLGLLVSVACGDESGPPPLPPRPPPSADHLPFLAQPAAALADSTITSAITVEIRDSVDRRINGAATAVTIAIGANPGTATLSGSTTLNAASGTATFSNLKINQRGRGYTLVASSGSLTPDTSAAFDVFAPLVVDAVASGDGHTCALKRGDATYCWGGNISGELGDSSNAEHRSEERR